MKFIDAANPQEFNKLVDHPLQSWEWGEFRKKTGTKVIRKISEDNKKAFQLTIHSAPFGFKIGYFPKGEMPTIDLINELEKIGREESLVYIQLEPNVKTTPDIKSRIKSLKLTSSFHPLFTRWTFLLDLKKSEEELLKNMHSKTRYNIKVAEKHDVRVKEDDSPKAFEKYLELTSETTKRQGFFAHTPSYHKKMWESLSSNSKLKSVDSNILSEHLFTASFKGEILTTWMIFIFKNHLYYPYGASSSLHRETMHSTLMCWEVIKYGKKIGLKDFDMWGSLGENADPKDPWYGFHNFKQKFGPELIEFIGSYDLVINPLVYKMARSADKFRWAYLHLKPR